MSDENKFYIETPALKIRLSKSLETSLPLFGISPEEFDKFKQYKIRRPNPPLVKNWASLLPSYNPEKQTFSFPFQVWTDEDYNAIIPHEMSHHIHYIINPQIFLESTEDLYERRRTNMIELVADYLLLSLNLIPRRHNFATNCQKTYEKHGLSFLPYLARMDLVTATNLDIIWR